MSNESFHIVDEHESQNNNMYDLNAVDNSFIPKDIHESVFNKKLMWEQECSMDSLNARCEMNNILLQNNIWNLAWQSIDIFAWVQEWLQISSIHESWNNTYGFQVKANEHLDIDRINALFENSDSNIRLEWSYEKGYEWFMQIDNIEWISNIYSQDKQLWISLMKMNTAKTFWLYAGYEKGTHFEKFVTSAWFQVSDNQKVKVTGAMLDKTIGSIRHSPIDEDIYDVETLVWHTTPKKQNFSWKEYRVWVETTYSFNNSLVKEIKWGLEYYKFEWDDLWNIQTENTILYEYSDENYDISEVLDWSSSTEFRFDSDEVAKAYLETTMQLSENLVTKTRLEYQKWWRYEGLNVWAEAKYKINNNSHINIYGEKTQVDSRYWAEYQHNFDNGISMQAGVSKYKNEFYNENQANIWVSIPLWKTKSSWNNPLDQYVNKEDTLSWNDIKPNNSINSNEFQTNPMLNVSDTVKITTNTTYTERLEDDYDNDGYQI